MPVHTRTAEEHQPSRNLVLNQLKENKFIVTKYECVFNTNQVDFQGEFFCSQGISILLNEIASLAQLSTPLVLKVCKGFSEFLMIAEGFLHLCKSSLTDVLVMQSISGWSL
jgi:hypothetical protein